MVEETGSFRADRECHGLHLNFATIVPGPPRLGEELFAHSSSYFREDFPAVAQKNGFSCKTVNRSPRCDRGAEPLATRSIHVA